MYTCGAHTSIYFSLRRASCLVLAPLTHAGSYVHAHAAQSFMPCSPISVLLTYAGVC